MKRLRIKPLGARLVGMFDDGPRTSTHGVTTLIDSVGGGY